MIRGSALAFSSECTFFFVWVQTNESFHAEEEDKMGKKRKCSVRKNTLAEKEA